jgi:hypothetical protein
MARNAREPASTVDIKIRMKEPLRSEIERSAKEKGISMNAEMVVRLSQSYDRERLLYGALELAYGREAAALISILVRELVGSGRISSLISSDLREAMDNWLYDPYAYRQAKNAANAVLDAFAPEGDPTVLKKGPWKNPDAGQVDEGKRRVRITLDAIKDPNWNDQFSEQQKNHELEAFASHIREMLGPLIARIPDDPEKKNFGGSRK